MGQHSDVVGAYLVYNRVSNYSIRSNHNLVHQLLRHDVSNHAICDQRYRNAVSFQLIGRKSGALKFRPGFGGDYLYLFALIPRSPYDP